MHAHVLAPLDADHRAAAAALARTAADAAGLPSGRLSERYHVSLAVAVGADPAALRGALVELAATTAPLEVRAHGFGLFCDRDPAGNSIHVPVVRSPSLEALRLALEPLVRASGGTTAGWTDAEHWTPHVTLLAEGLTTERIGRAFERLAARHHPSWAMRLDRLAVAPPQGGPTTAELLLQGG